MTIDDLFDNSDQQQQMPVALNPLQQLMQRNTELDKQIEAIKNKKPPSIAEPTQDTNSSLTDDVLRGFFKSAMPPNDNTPDFGSQYAQSISPARELLANMLNGVSSSLLGTKFKTVRDQAFEQYQQEQKLNLEKQNLQRQTLSTAATLAQQMQKQKAQDALERDIESVKSAQKGTDQEIALMKLKQTADQYGINVASLLEKMQHDKATESKMSDKFYEDARQQALALYKSQGLDPEKPENALSFSKLVSDRANQLRLRDLQEQAANRPAPEPKTPTPAIVYVPQPDGSLKVAQAAPGATLPPGTVTGQGVNALSVPTANTRAMAEKAPNVKFFTDNIRTILDNNEKLFGPLKTNWKDFEAGKLGQKGEDITALRTNADFLNSALVQMHYGQKGGQETAKRFQELYEKAKNNPDNLRAYLNVVSNYADRVAKEGSAKLPKAVETGSVGDLSAGSGKTVKMVFPGGQERDVPESDVNDAVSKYGGRRK